jgi:hypothetical protein
MLRSLIAGPLRARRFGVVWAEGREGPNRSLPSVTPW